MRKSILGSVLFLSLALAAPKVHADDLKIGVVDMQKALLGVEAGKRAKSQLEKEGNAKSKEIQGEEAALKKADAEFRKQQLVMNDEARAKKQGELQERFMKFQQMRQQTLQELQTKEQELTAPILAKLRGIIGDMAKQKGYSIVLEKNENTVLFSQDKDDLTGDVIGIYNKLGKS